jgi:hypothetical protein
MAGYENRVASFDSIYQQNCYDFPEAASSVSVNSREDMGHNLSLTFELTVRDCL